MRSRRRLVSLLVWLWAAPAWALQPVAVDQLGARPDGVVRTDCAITSGQAVLTCTGGQFVPQDVGKVIGVYGAGPTVSGFVQPLATTIASRQSATQVTLAAAASATVNPSTRMVYGSNNTTVLQRLLDTQLAAPDGRGGNVGGTLQFGPGLYLVTTLKLPCGAIGTFNYGTCPRSYNRITIQGAGAGVTTLENWNPAAESHGLIHLGAYASTPDETSDGNQPVTGVMIADLTLHQVLNATAVNNVIFADATSDVRFERLTITGTSYDGLTVRGRRVVIRDTYASGNGSTGPAGAGILSAFNIAGCTDCLFVNNRFDKALGGADYGMEGNAFRSVFQGNTFVCSAAGGAIQWGSSAGEGHYDNVFQGNVLRNCSMNTGNGSGPWDRNYILHNTFINASLALDGGIDAPSVVNPYYTDTVVHGQSVADGNTFIRDGAVPLAAQLIVGNLHAARTSQESWLVSNNKMVVRGTHCSVSPFAACWTTADCGAGSCGLQGVNGWFIEVNAASGGSRWAPSTACTEGTSYVYPVVFNGFYYACTTAGTTGTTEPTWPTTLASTVNDGDAVWTIAGRKPSVVLQNNTVEAPNLGTALRVLLFAAPAGPFPDRDAVTVIGLSANVPWKVDSFDVANMPLNDTELVPANAVADDMHHWRSALPTVGLYRVNTQITNVAPSSGHRGWVATREGRAGAAWQAGQAYAFGDWVVPTVDNAHAYTQRTGAGCTSHAVTEPTWSTDDGGVASDNTCSWKESGAAVLWLEF